MRTENNSKILCGPKTIPIFCRDSFFFVGIEKNGEERHFIVVKGNSLTTFKPFIRMKTFVNTIHTSPPFFPFYSFSNTSCKFNPIHNFETFHSNERFEKYYSYFSPLFSLFILFDDNSVTVCAAVEIVVGFLVT